MSPIGQLISPSGGLRHGTPLFEGGKIERLALGYQSLELGLRSLCHILFDFTKCSNKLGASARQIGRASLASAHTNYDYRLPNALSNFPKQLSGNALMHSNSYASFFDLTVLGYVF